MAQLTFAAAREIYRTSLAAYEAMDFDSMTADNENDIANAHYETWDNVIQAPAVTGTGHTEHDERLLADRVTATPLGVAGKLRYALYLDATSPWLQAAALGAVVPDMAQRMDMENAPSQAIWSAIQSLEAMEARS